MTKRYLLLALSLFAALSLGLSPPSKWLKPFLHYSGYYFIFIAFFLWVFLVLKVSCGKFKSFIKTHYPAILLSFGLMSLIFYSHPPRFKILADEANLVGVSMAMHQDKTVSLPIQGLALDYAVFNPEHKLDKRPLLFPYLVSLTHSIFGYSPYNGYVVNFILGLALLFITYLLISFIFSRFYGTLSIIVLSSYPLFIVWVTSSGFDVLNLFFIVFLFLVLYLFLEHPDQDVAELLLLSLVLLSQCRYESIIFLFAFVFLIPSLVKNRYVFNFKFITYISPFLLLPVIWQRRLFTGTDEPVRIGHQLFKSANQLFDVSHLATNVSKNIFVLSGMDSRFGFLPFITLLAVIGCYLMFKRLVIDFKTIDKKIKGFSLIGFVSILSLFFIHSLYFWGNYANPTANRFALVFLPFLIVSASFFIYQLVKNPGKCTKIAIILLAATQFLHYKPVSEKEWILQGLSLTHEYNKTTSYLSSVYNTMSDNLLIISDLPSLYFIHDVGSIDFRHANKDSDKIKFLRHTYYDTIIVFQRCKLEDNKPNKKNMLKQNYQLTQVGRINISQDFYIKISEVNRIL